MRIRLRAKSVGVCQHPASWTPPTRIRMRRTTCGRLPQSRRPPAAWKIVTSWLSATFAPGSPQSPGRGRACTWPRKPRLVAADETDPEARRQPPAGGSHRPMYAMSTESQPAVAEPKKLGGPAPGDSEALTTAALSRLCSSSAPAATLSHSLHRRTRQDAQSLMVGCESSTSIWPTSLGCSCVDGPAKGWSSPTSFCAERPRAADEQVGRSGLDKTSRQHLRFVFAIACQGP